jgi:hypothetical protein
MTRPRDIYNATIGKTGMQPRVFVSISLVTLLLLTLLVACGDSDSPTATVNSTLVNATATSTAAVPPVASGSAKPSTGPAASAAPSTAPTSTTSAGSVAAASDGSCPADHPVKGGQIGPLKSYSVSGSTSYDTMRASECFATEADAEAAGYHKSGR